MLNNDNPAQANRPFRLGAAVLLVFVLAVAVYLPKAGNGFTFDDRIFIQQDLSLRTLPTALQQFGADQARLYRPLRSVVYALLILLFGLDSPLPFHLAGILFHAAISALVFAVVWLLFNRPRIALITGLVFALHPVHADRVANITGSFDLFGLMLGYAAWAFALLYDRDGRPYQLAGSALLLSAGCLGSEETLMIWPLVLAGFLVKPGDWRRRATLLITLGLVAAAYLATRTMVLSGVGRTAEYAAGSLGNSLLTMTVVFWRYLLLLVFPFGLTPAYGPTVYQTFSAAPLFGLIGMALLAATAVVYRRRLPMIALAIGWFFIALLPFTNLLPGDTIMAERYLYSALGGFALLLGWALTQVTNRRAVVVLSVVILSVYATATVQRCLLWGQPRQLWTQAAQAEPDSFLANLNAGYHLLRAGQTEPARQHAERAAQLDSSRAEPLLLLGEIAIKSDEREHALHLFKQAVEIEPHFCPARIALAQGYVMVGDMKRAAATIEAALDCDPSDPAAHYTAGYLYFIAGRCDLARPHLQTTIDAYPPAQHRDAAAELLQKCDETSESPHPGK